MGSNISYRHFKDKDDLELQYQFWKDITSDMKYAWKMTTSPSQFFHSDGFDPKTRYFAFEEQELVGYMSFTAHDSFISLGYPWVLPGYEGIREELWDEIYHYAIGEYGGEILTQRFRSQWDEQIKFFKEHGFKVTDRNPILILDLQPFDISKVSQPDLSFSIHTSFSIDDYLDLLSSHNDLSAEAESNTRLYFETISFDFVFELSRDEIPLVMMGVTHRKDTGFGEIIAFTFQPGEKQILKMYAPYFFNHLKNKGVKQLAITVGQDSELIELFDDLGFEHKSDDIYVSQYLQKRMK